jgi:hypothetical protein
MAVQDGVDGAASGYSNIVGQLAQRFSRSPSLAQFFCLKFYHERRFTILWMTRD